MDPFVQAFNDELGSITDTKPPVSRAKMTAITKAALKAIKHYKHVVMCVEKFIAKCRPEYKLQGLYVIDAILRQSRHQFGGDKEVFGPRFARNLSSTVQHVWKCPPEQQPKIERVLHLWQRNSIYDQVTLEPLFSIIGKPAAFSDNNQQAQPAPSSSSTDAEALRAMQAKQEEQLKQLQALQEQIAAQQHQQQQHQQQSGSMTVTDMQGVEHPPAAAPQQQQPPTTTLSSFGQPSSSSAASGPHLYEPRHGDDPFTFQTQGARGHGPRSAAATTASNSDVHGNHHHPRQQQQQPQERVRDDYPSWQQRSSSSRWSPPPSDQPSWQPREQQQEPQQQSTNSLTPALNPSDLLRAATSAPGALSRESRDMQATSANSSAPGVHHQHSHRGSGSLFDDFDYGDDEDEDARLAEQQRRMEADQHRLQSNTSDDKETDAEAASRWPTVEEQRSSWQAFVAGGDTRGRDSDRSWNKAPPPDRQGSGLRPITSGMSSTAQRQLQPQQNRAPPAVASKAQMEIDALWEKDPASEQRERERAAQRSTSINNNRTSSTTATSSSASLSTTTSTLSRSSRWSNTSPERHWSDSPSKPRASQLADNIEREQEEQLMRQQKGFPSPRPNMVTVCSRTLFVGRLAKSVTEATLNEEFSRFGPVESVEMIFARGCAFVCLATRSVAVEALANCHRLVIHRQSVKVSWATGKGIKGNEVKSFWNVQLGASYIPWEKVNDDSVSLFSLSDGCVIDPTTLPPGKFISDLPQAPVAVDSDDAGTQSDAQPSNSILTSLAPHPQATSSSGLMPMAPPPFSMAQAAAAAVAGGFLPGASGKPTLPAVNASTASTALPSVPASVTSHATTTAAPPHPAPGLPTPANVAGAPRLPPQLTPGGPLPLPPNFPVPPGGLPHLSGLPPPPFPGGIRPPPPIPGTGQAAPPRGPGGLPLPLGVNGPPGIRPPGLPPRPGMPPVPGMPPRPGMPLGPGMPPGPGLPHPPGLPPPPGLPLPPGLPPHIRPGMPPGLPPPFPNRLPPPLLASPDQRGNIGPGSDQHAGPRPRPLLPGLPSSPHAGGPGPSRFPRPGLPPHADHHPDQHASATGSDRPGAAGEGEHRADRPGRHDSEDFDIPPELRPRPGVPLPPGLAQHLSKIAGAGEGFPGAFGDRVPPAIRPELSGFEQSSERHPGAAPGDDRSNNNNSGRSRSAWGDAASPGHRDHGPGRSRGRDFDNSDDASEGPGFRGGRSANRFNSSGRGDDSSGRYGASDSRDSRYADGDSRDNGGGRHSDRGGDRSERGARADRAEHDDRDKYERGSRRRDDYERGDRSGGDRGGSDHRGRNRSRERDRDRNRDRSRDRSPRDRPAKDSRTSGRGERGGSPSRRDGSPAGAERRRDRSYSRERSPDTTSSRRRRSPEQQRSSRSRRGGGDGDDDRRSSRRHHRRSASPRDHDRKSDSKHRHSRSSSTHHHNAKSERDEAVKGEDGSGPVPEEPATSENSKTAKSED